MAWTFGRISIAQDLLVWHSTGTSVTVTGGYTGASVAAALVVRDQFLGYVANVDEPVVPVTSTGDSRINGFYRVLAVDITTPPETLFNAHFDYRIELEPVKGFISATVESFLTGAVMVNDFTVTTLAQPWHAVPGAAVSYFTGWPSLVTEVNRTGEDGTNQFFWVAPAPASYKTLVKYTLAPASFYQGAAQIQSGVIAANLQPVVGTQAAPATGDWRLTNGIVRVEGNAGLGLKVTWWNGGIWGAQHTFNFAMVSFGGFTGEEPYIRILRNSPEAVVIRVTLRGGALNAGAIQLDLELRRGARTVRLYMSWANVGAMSFAHQTAAACTALTAGAIQSSNFDADGVTKWIMQCSKTMTQDLVNGGLVQASSTFTKCDFGLSSAISGTGNAAQDLVYQYLAYVAERMQVVAR